ncbi:S9 family peptidase [Streptacidiphilus jiangxiensis]|uniref:Dipeptidyl aminopeptidase/acylaminoacyl peptidase n=1 Tax=Streptacidiphilus jiangxiensis TaxID=235985 RepID=A0A1H7VXT9_STRJI|nr:alpha/beta fold hydrolase [Streptacidiphilus jiangxiensis]SEM13595.1 Dipeptidyl aminopeptidase/acylaminoacyl peptidase [Streptacidiphilus jiangxiensis]
MTAIPLTVPPLFGSATGPAPGSAALRRVSFTFAADGSHAACLAAEADGRWFVESWRLGAEPGEVCAPQPLRPGAGGRRSEDVHSQLVSLTDGRVLICRHEGAVQQLIVRGTDGHADLSAGRLQRAGLRLLPLPAPAPGAPVAIALGTDGEASTSVWLISANGVSAPQQVAELPGLYGGGVWLDQGGRLLGLDQLQRLADGTGRVKTVALDLATGGLSPLLELTARSNDRLAACDPVSGLVLVRSDAPGEDRLGWGRLGSQEPPHFPECLRGGQHFLRPVAIEPGRNRVAVQADWGAGSTLALWEPGATRLEPLPVPPGRLGGVAHWSAAGLRMPYSAPDQPAAMASIDVDLLLSGETRPLPQPESSPRLAPVQGGAAGLASVVQVIPQPVETGWRLDGGTRRGDGRPWESAQTVTLPGAAGPLEGVVYGGNEWLTAEHLVMALHGGPADAWRLEFEPTLQRLAAEGLAVVAPNQRGSTGYGVEHAQAVQHAWGGPDLEDVLTLLQSIGGQRASLGLERVALLGVSYGAFLALLAAGTAPDLVAKVAAVSPFLSGARLAAEAGPAVRGLTERMGATTDLPDGPRDVLLLCHRLMAELLVVHGTQDEVVPVTQSRALRQELLRIGRVEGVDFQYVEAAGAGHEVLAEEGAPLLQELLASFLRATRVGNCQ